MAQFARPSADTTNENYLDEGGASTALFESIDEATRSDSDYVESQANPPGDAYVTALTTVEDPQSSSSHTVRYAYQKDASGGTQINLDVELREAYTDEVSQGTLIASWSHTDIGNGFTQQDQLLSSGEADSITDYSDLYIRIVSTQV